MNSHMKALRFLTLLVFALTFAAGVALTEARAQDRETPYWATLRFDGSTWAPLTADLQNLPEIGVNTDCAAEGTHPMLLTMTRMTNATRNHGSSGRLSGDSARLRPIWALR